MTGAALSVKVRLGKVNNHYGLMFNDGKSVTSIREDMTMEQAARTEGGIGSVFDDFITEAHAIFAEADRTVAPYIVESADLGTDEDGSVRLKMYVPSTPGFTWGYDRDQCGWMTRPMAYGIFDIHLPRMNLSLPVMNQLDRYLAVAMRLAAKQTKIVLSDYHGSLRVEAENPISGVVRLALGKSFQDAMASMASRQLSPAKQDEKNRMMQGFLDAVAGISGDVISAIAPYGFEFIGERGKTGSWEAFIPAEISFHADRVQPVEGETEKLLLGRLEFEAKLLLSIHRDR